MGDCFRLASTVGVCLEISEKTGVVFAFTLLIRGATAGNAVGRWMLVPCTINMPLAGLRHSEGRNSPRLPGPARLLLCESTSARGVGVGRDRACRRYGAQPNAQSHRRPLQPRPNVANRLQRG